jgi:hypothetical protein
MLTQWGPWAAAHFVHWIKWLWSLHSKYYSHKQITDKDINFRTVRGPYNWQYINIPVEEEISYSSTSIT